MLATSETVGRELPLSHRPGARPHHDHPRSDDYIQRKRERDKLKYQERKAAGLCAYGYCPNQAEPLRTQCGKHLRKMARRAAERRNERIAQLLCIYCGVRPQFWGKKCIICRQTLATEPLPSGAKRSLRRHREAEARRLRQQIEEDARKAVLNLLESQEVQGKQAEALRLYAGIDNGKWRTYREVGKLMNISFERVRQLLVPSKLALSLMLFDGAPWRPLERNESNREGKVDTTLSTACRVCNNIALKILDHESYLYEDCGLPNVVLFGLPVNHCQGCNTETVSIPRISDLHRKLARAVLLKPAALTGGELRFLRTVAGLSTGAFAEELGVAIQTIQAWERSEALRYLNDLGARVVIATLIALSKDCSPIFEILSSIKARRPEPDQVSAHWINEEAKWVVNPLATCN